MSQKKAGGRRKGNKLMDPHLLTSPYYILPFKKLNSDNSFSFYVVTLRVSVDLMLGGMQLVD